jgi:quercetin dioxygenase-like cupin family protein
VLITKEERRGGKMKVIKSTNIPKIVPEDPIFTGAVTVQPLIHEGNTFMSDVVNFSKGVRNKLHTHTTDQILIITHGKGYVATESEKVEIEPGDIIHIPAGEKHWHGATENSEMSHIHIVGAGSPCTVVET